MIGNNFAESVIRAFQGKEDYVTAYQLQHDLMNDEIMKQREKEIFKREIIKEIMSEISIQIEATAIQKLEDMINRLGK